MRQTSRTTIGPSPRRPRRILRLTADARHGVCPMFRFFRRHRPPRPVHDRLPTFAPGQTGPMLEALHTDGFALIRGVLTVDEVTAARDAIDRLEPIHWDFTGRTDHYKNVFNRDPFWLSFLDRAGVIDLAEASLGAECHIVGETAWRSHPGHHGVGLHLDYLPMQWPEPGVPKEIPMPMFLCTAHFYLSPQPIDLCPSYVVPGSHRAGRKPKPTESEWRGRRAQPVLCNAGDVLFFRSDLWHSGS